MYEIYEVPTLWFKLTLDKIFIIHMQLLIYFLLVSIYNDVFHIKFAQ